MEVLLGTILKENTVDIYMIVLHMGLSYVFCMYDHSVLLESLQFCVKHNFPFVSRRLSTNKMSY